MMTRRNLLQFAGLGLGAAALPNIGFSGLEKLAPVGAGSGSGPVKPSPNSATYRFRLGDWEAVNFAGGIWDMPGGHPFFAPQATKEEYEAAMGTEFLPTDKVRLYFNILLLRTGKENILIDAGFAPEQSHPHFNLAANLSLVGLKPSDITKVFLSHAHGDHMGGLLDASGKPVFGNAEHLCLAQEHDFWTSAKPEWPVTRYDEKGREQGTAAARRTFEAIRFTRIQDNTTLPEGLQAIHSPGHTPGHATFRFSNKGESLYHIVDLAHQYALMLPHPEWTVAFDVNEAQAARTRKDVFARLAAEKTPVFGYHMPFPALGRLRADGTGYRWVSRTWDPCL